jgi:sigma-B regulation protein RsbU (phosphoserine phosphatase)
VRSLRTQFLLVFLFLFLSFFGLGYYLYRYRLVTEWERLAYEQVASELKEKAYLWDKKKKTIEQWMRYLVRAESQQIQARDIPGRFEILQAQDLEADQKSHESLVLLTQVRGEESDICASRFWETLGRGVRLCFPSSSWKEAFFEQSRWGFLIYRDRILLAAQPHETIESITWLKNSGFLQQFIGQDLVTTWDEQGQIYFIGSRHFPRDEVTFVTLIPQASLTSRWASLIVQARALTLVILSLTAFIGFLLLRWMLNPLESVTEQLKAIAGGNFEIRFLKRPRNEIGTVMQVVEWMAERIRELLARTKETARLENEIKTVQILQNNFYPKNHYEFGPYRLTGLIRPSQECGGDFWYCWHQVDRTYVLIADATGHGVSAALLTSSIFSLVHLFQEQAILSLPLMARYLNNTVYQMSRGQWVVTGILLELDEKTGLMRWIHASHESLIYIPPQASSWKDIEFLQDPNHAPWGESAEGAKAYLVGEKLLKRGSQLVLYTDGIWDWRPMGGEKKWTERQFYKALVNQGKELLDDFSRSAQVTPDDVTFVMITVDPKAQWVQGYDQLHLPLTEILTPS